MFGPVAFIEQKENDYNDYNNFIKMYRECDSVVSSQRTPALPNLRFS